MVLVFSCRLTQDEPSVSLPIAQRENCAMKTTTEFESVSNSGFYGEIKGILEVIQRGSDLIRFTCGLTLDAQTGGKSRPSSRFPLNFL